MVENEWDMQKRLTPQWTEHGANVGEDRLFLAAWEVMTSWKINDSRKNWTYPSIDFLFLDKKGTIFLVEMKRTVEPPGAAWNVLCQVSHRVVALRKSYSFEKLCAAYTACWSGDHGRVEGSKPLELRETHQAFFGLSEPLSPDQFGQGEWRRVVAANVFSKNWCVILNRFANEDLDSLKDAIKSSYKIESKGNLELKRFIIEVTAEAWASQEHVPVTWTLESKVAEDEQALTSAGKASLAD